MASHEQLCPTCLEGVTIDTPSVDDFDDLVLHFGTGERCGQCSRPVTPEGLGACGSCAQSNLHVVETRRMRALTVSDVCPSRIPNVTLASRHRSNLRDFGDHLHDEFTAMPNRVRIGFARFCEFGPPRAFSGSGRDRESRAHAKISIDSLRCLENRETEWLSASHLNPRPPLRLFVAKLPANLARYSLLIKAAELQRSSSPCIRPAASHIAPSELR